MMMLDVHLVPAVAVVDYELSLSMPPDLTAHVGLDTLTHGIEAYVSRKANPMTDPIALSCIRLVAAHLETAWAEPGNRAAREGMALAACQGGMAFANSSVCLVHGMSRPIGALFHLPHGLSNAVLLAAVTRFSLPGALDRYATVARVMGCAGPDTPDADAADALAEALPALGTRLGLRRLRDCVGMDHARFESLLEKMAGDALASGSPQNNPVVPTAEEIVALYRQAW
jgi:alcohol dehydrogenase class IV